MVEEEENRSPLASFQINLKVRGARCQSLTRITRCEYTSHYEEPPRTGVKTRSTSGMMKKLMELKKSHKSKAQLKSFHKTFSRIN